MPRRRGLTLIELVTVVALLVVLSLLLIPVGQDARRQGSLNASLGNLRWFGVAGSAYASDHADRFWTFSWLAGVEYELGGEALTPAIAAANQATWMIRERADRGEGSALPIEPPSGWIPHIYYSHLTLLEHAGIDFLSERVVSPEDRVRRVWRADPLGIGALPDHQRPVGDEGEIQRWAYSTSYVIGSAFLSADVGGRLGDTLSQHGLWASQFDAPAQNGVLGQRTLSEVAFPSQKAMVWDAFQRHFGPREPFCLIPEARIPILVADGSVGVRTAGTSNAGFQPNNPSGGPSRMAYFGERWEPEPMRGAGTSDFVDGLYRYTRSGLRGRDFGGPEVEWVDP